ncbi:hypothetical protein MGSAQ_001272 [marine sediment metagenome]|uniref:Uncharacterized protein n=1 Tax=marine sediment metagenome TaxID=412755 RepID=A0A1B6NV85_9ZZZZ
MSLPVGEDCAVFVVDSGEVKIILLHILCKPLVGA